MSRIRRSEIVNHFAGYKGILVAELGGHPYTFSYIHDDRAEVERWLEDARHRVRAGEAPRDIPLLEGCPLRPAEPAC